MSKPESFLVACDIYRPAAIRQLQVVGEGVQTPVYADLEQRDVVRIAQDGVRAATLSLSSNGGSPTLEMLVEVASPAQLTLSPSSLDLRTTTTSQTAGVMNTGGQPLTWSATGGASWVTLSRSSGTVDPRKTQPVRPFTRTLSHLPFDEVRSTASMSSPLSSTVRTFA